MRHLILFRHGKAETMRPGEDDHDRALAPRGWDDAPMVARALAARGISPDVAVISTARRCRETWAAMSGVFPGAAAEETEDLYLASPKNVFAIAEASGGDMVIVIGHNPGLQDLAASLAPRAPEASSMRIKFPTSAAAVFGRSSDADEWRLDLFLTAKELRPIADD